MTHEYSHHLHLTGKPSHSKAPFRKVPEMTTKMCTHQRHTRLQPTLRFIVIHWDVSSWVLIRLHHTSCCTYLFCYFLFHLTDEAVINLWAMCFAPCLNQIILYDDGARKTHDTSTQKCRWLIEASCHHMWCRVGVFWAWWVIFRVFRILKAFLWNVNQTQSLSLT
jgi:hypothetical protein